MAANSILKLKVDNTEYDANIKKAAEGIQHLAKRMHDAQGDFEGLDKESLDFIKNLQYMTTSAKTASGQYRELENAYKNLAATYEGLNAFEKEGDAGKALAEQLEILKNRTLDMKANMDAASKSLQTNAMEGQEDSSALSKLADKFVVNVDAIKLFNVGLQAAEGALNVAKDAFFNNEEQLDEWGRIVESSQSLYEGFLNALNTGDISGFLSNIGRIEQAARDAYDALDALGTYNAFNQINIERTRTNMTESIADFRGGKGTKEGVKAAGDAYKKELADRQRLEQEAYVAAVKEMAAKRGANAKDLMDALSGTYGHYQDLKNVQPSGTRTRYIPGLPGQAGRYEEYKVAQNNQERLGEALRHLNDTELQSLQALGAQAQRTGTEIAQVDKQLTRVLNAKQPGTGSTDGKGGKDTKTEQTELQQNQTKINALTQEYVKLGDVETDASRKRQEEIRKEIELLQQRNGLLGLRAEQAQGRLLPTNIQTAGLSNTPGTLLKAPDTSIPTGGLQLSDKAMNAVQKNISKQLKDVDGLADKWGSVSSAISAVGNAMAAVEDPAAKVLGIVAQAIATVALTFAKSLSGTITPWDWIAAAAAGTATMISTISAIHSATGYAEGGMIKGNSYSGDNLVGMVDGGAGGFVGLNAGEIVLNKSQQTTLAQNLQGNPMGGLNLTATIKGEQIRLALNNNGRRTGRGEYVQSRNVK